MDSIADILADLAAGRMIVLVDDESRENEGDLVFAAEHASPELVNFMLREARGMLCVALDPQRCAELELEPQSRVNTTQRGTAFTVSVDAAPRFGVTTGVSAADRAATIRLLADPDAKPDDFDRPGHTHPLRAREGGSLVRAGQTEGSVDLCRLAGLKPAAAIIEVMNEDGTMARRPELEQLCERFDLKMCTVADVIHYRLEREKLVQRVESAEIETEFGPFQLFAYRSLVDPLPHVALVAGDLGRRDPAGWPVDADEPVLVRMHSQNLLGDVFGDLAEPSGRTLRESMKLIQQAGRGVIVYLRHGGAGSGLARRLQTPAPLPDEPPAAEARPSLRITHPAANAQPPRDQGGYGVGCQILRDLGVRQLRLITHHPFTPTALAGFGLSIEAFVEPGA